MPTLAQLPTLLKSPVSLPSGRTGQQVTIRSDGTIRWTSATPISVQAYGASPTATVAANDAAFAAWVNALNVSGGGHGYVPAGHYILSAAWPTITNSNVVIEVSPAATLDWSAAATGTKFVTVQGTEGSTVALTADAAEGSTSLSVAAGNEAGFAGSYLRIASTAIWDTGRTNTPIGETALCTTTTSGVINLWTRTVNPSGCTTPILPGTGTGHLVNNNQWGANPPARSNLVGSIGASPWVWQNTTSQRVGVAINGGTVSAIKYSRDNVNFYATNTAGLPTVDPGDYLQITYTVPPTTFEVFPQR